MTSLAMAFYPVNNGKKDSRGETGKWPIATGVTGK